MAGKAPLVDRYARMWPREVFYRFAEVNGTRRRLVTQPELAILDHAGVYVLYRDDVPYYIGNAGKLRTRLRRHAYVPKSRYYNFWNFFSVFVVEDPERRDEIEGILIAAMPTANSAEPRLPRENLPKQIVDMIRAIRRAQANPHGF